MDKERQLKLDDSTLLRIQITKFWPKYLILNICLVLIINYLVLQVERHAW